MGSKNTIIINNLLKVNDNKFEPAYSPLQRREHLKCVFLIACISSFVCLSICKIFVFSSSYPKTTTWHNASLGKGSLFN